MFHPNTFVASRRTPQQRSAWGAPATSAQYNYPAAWGQSASRDTPQHRQTRGVEPQVVRSTPWQQAGRTAPPAYRQTNAPTWWQPPTNRSAFQPTARTAPWPGTTTQTAKLPRSASFQATRPATWTQPSVPRSTSFQAPRTSVNPWRAAGGQRSWPSTQAPRPTSRPQAVPPLAVQMAKPLHAAAPHAVHTTGPPQAMAPRLAPIGEETRSMDFSYPAAHGEGHGQLRYFQRLYEDPLHAEQTATLADQNQLLHRGLLFMLEEVHRLRGAEGGVAGPPAVTDASAHR